MATLSPKYIAGFLDADGSIGVVFHADCVTPQLRIGFSQKTEQDEVLHRIHEEWGGCLGYMKIGGVSYTRLTYSGNKQCLMLLNRIKQFLVIKRHYAEVCIDVATRRIEKDEIPKVREYLKIQRKQRSLPLPKHPSRKWMAGYVDGDGCISVTGLSDRGSAKVVLHIAASAYDTEGIEIIQKQFGGAIHDMCDGRVRQYVLSLQQPSKVKDVLEEIAPSMVVKRSQAEFLLKCASMGHYRDGRSIRDALKHLKAHPHRLSEPKPDVHALFLKVADLPPHEIDYSARSSKAWETRRAMR